MSSEEEYVEYWKEYEKKYGFHNQIAYSVAKKGISEEVIRNISETKNEPEWMLKKRLEAYEIFKSKPLPTWGADLSSIDFSDIYYYLKPGDARGEDSWNDVPKEIKETFDKLGIPEAERKFFAGTSAQYDSEVVYSRVVSDLEKEGVIFVSTDEAVQKYPEIVKKYFGTVVPPSDNKFAALNTAVWSGGSMIYVPKGVKVKLPLQAYFRINAEKAGQFERTLIVADEGADVTYIEGCFVAGTKIATEEGLKPIETIRVGDKVLTHRARYKRVYHTQIRLHTGKLYRIRYGESAFADVWVTGEHPFFAIKKEEYGAKSLPEPKWIRADELEEGDYLTMPANGMHFSGQDPESINLREIRDSRGKEKMIIIHGSKAAQLVLQDGNAYVAMPIIEIACIDVADLPVYNFSVEEDESYVAEGVYVHNCTAPIYMSSSLHAAVVELVAHKNAHIRYVTIQNWSKNVYNLVTQRAYAYENAFVEWIDGNIGSKANMKYPSIFLRGENARGRIISVAVANNEQHQDSGGKVYHLAKNTTSEIISKSVSIGNGVTTYRGLIHIGENAENAKSNVKCDALLIGDNSKTNTFPYMEIKRDDSYITHEATTGKIGEEQLFYLESRGLSEEEATTMIIYGFLSPLAEELPVDYSIELRRLIKLNISNPVG